MLQRTQNAAFLGGAYVFPGGSLDPRTAMRASCGACVGLTEARGQRAAAASPPAASPTTSPRCANVSRRPASCLPATKRRAPIRRARESLMHWRKRPVQRAARSRGPLHPGAATSPTSATGSPRPAARGASTRASSSRSRRRASTARTTPPRPCTTSGSRRARRSSAARAAKSSWCIATQTALKRPGALQRSARRVRVRARTCPRSKRTAPAGRKARKARSSSAARDPQYFEIHWSDPEETGQTQLRHRRRRAQAPRPRVTRLIAPNPGVMTGPGHQYLSRRRDELAVIDPGPALDSHVEKILRARTASTGSCARTRTSTIRPRRQRSRRRPARRCSAARRRAGQDATFKPDSWSRTASASS